jgi:hypothetical protein
MTHHFTLRPNARRFASAAMTDASALDVGTVLRGSIHAWLCSDHTLTAVLGGAKVFHAAPAHALPPCVVIGAVHRLSVRPGDLHPDRHLLALDVLSRPSRVPEARWTAARVAWRLQNFRAEKMCDFELAEIRLMETVATPAAGLRRFDLTTLRFQVATVMQPTCRLPRPIPAAPAGESADELALARG